MALLKLFPSLIFQRKLQSSQSRLHKLIEKECYKFKNMDRAGKLWSLKNYPGGYTSYGSIPHIQKISPYFLDLGLSIDKAVKAYLISLRYDIKFNQLKMTNFWINIMPRSVFHSAHIHPHSVVSGTFYVKVPPGASALKFEDPRLAQFMVAPEVKTSAKREFHRFIEVQPSAGEVVLFEGWMRHEVPMNQSQQDRISVSFNYEWAK